MSRELLNEPTTRIQDTMPFVETMMCSVPPRGHALDEITGPLDEIARRSSSLVANPMRGGALAGAKGTSNIQHSTFNEPGGLPRYVFVGPQDGGEPLRIGVFGGLHGDEPASAFGLVRFVEHLERHPELARGYCLFLYPVCNLTGFRDGTRHARSGRDLN